MHVCCPRVFCSIAYYWIEYHVLSIGVLYFARIKTFTCICQDSNNSWNQVPIGGVQISLVWRFLLRQFRLKLVLLNETSMCWNVDISRNGCNLGMYFTSTTPGRDKYFYPKRKPRISLPGMQEKVFRDFHQRWLKLKTCNLKIPSLRITVRHHSTSLAMLTVTFVTEFSIRSSQPLKILINVYNKENV